VLGGQNIPNQARIGLGVFLAIILIPWQPLPADAASLSLILFVVAIAKEIVIGTLLGFAASLTFGALLIAAEAMGSSSGFSSGHTLNPAMGETGSAYNQLFVMITTLYFLVIDGHHWVLQALQRSFEVLPLNGNLPPASMETLMRMTAQLIAAGIQISLPVLGALLLTDITLGLLSRVAPASAGLLFGHAP